ncbi:MAG: hypothetical protein KatS3mg110_1028 [Pirellulaceae bacterium]|nr:MAG: hypothetical protein KatS3mg110_1028 [Pirellulaceae bacterium]
MRHSRQDWFRVTWRTAGKCLAVVWLVVYSPLGMAQPQRAAESPTASQVMEEALAASRAFPDLEARVRLVIHLMENRLSGFGTYQQSSQSDRVRFRYEWRLPGSERTISWLEVFDGDYLWTRTDWEGQLRLEFVDIGRLRRDEAVDSERLVYAGGVPGLFYGLKQAYQFTTLRATSLGREPVWEIIGTWKSEGRRSHDASQSGTQRLRVPVPGRVRLFLSRDAALPYFPFRVEYYGDEEATDGDPMMTLEFYEVRAGSGGDPRRYVYIPGDQPFSDVTERWRAALRSE